MNDVDTRARVAASGLRRAVDHFEAVGTVAERSSPSRRRLVIAAAGLVAAALVVAGVVAWRADTSSIRTVDHPPPRGITSVDVGGEPIAITVDPHGVFVANGTNEVVRLDRRTGRLATRVATDQPVDHVAAGPSLGVWGFNTNPGFRGDAPGYLTRVLLSGRPPTTVRLPARADEVALGDGHVWIIDAAGDLTARDPRTLKITYQTNFGRFTQGSSLALADNRVWLATSTTLFRLPARVPHRSRPQQAASLLRSGYRFKAIATDGHSLWDSVCVDTIVFVCSLERRDAATGKLQRRFNDHPLWNQVGDATLVESNGAIWAMEGNGSLLRTTKDGGVKRVLNLPAPLRASADPWIGNRAFAVGAGALWYSVPEQGRVYRIPLR